MLAKALVSIIVAATAFSGTAAASDFSKTCWDCYLTSSGQSAWLNCVCGAIDGRQVSTFLDLNDCYVNNGGHLAVQLNGNFLASCYGPSLDPPRELTVACGDGVGDITINHLNLDNTVENYDGLLACSP
ncbi:hypothetical protein AMS68_005040 [Peltaster fructicola]|uniref:Cyanovirin-N domain-containing protein n=1 Tax=Peltaster fructicola TaxID=286661 RepID=A0A6H0XXP2_9PEZI|nr:hypothetical protein AMS68_005040 [Peltaster fructicola]